MHYSLADVAGEKYSTSLISQIERNRVDASTESLRYLAERLQLPYDELQIMARQQRESETEANLYQEFEVKYAEINQLLLRKQPDEALKHFEQFKPEQLPLFLRWRTLALRGQVYFDLREFFKAQRDFRSALTILPPAVALEAHQLEIIQLHLHMAEATRELNQFEQALEHYHVALETMDDSTALCSVAETHWGIALVYYNQGYSRLIQEGNTAPSQALLQQAWQHAENARRLYHAIMDTLNADLLQCLLAQIELTQGKAASGKKRLLTVLSIWQPTLQADPREHPARRAPRANIISAAACYLAGIECQARDFQRSLAYIDIAIQAGLESYKVRQAEAFMMKGQILEAQNGRGKANALDPMIEESYKQAIHVLKDTGRTGTLSQAHYEFGRYLLSIGRHEQGNQEMEIARVLVGIPGNFNAR